MKNICNELDNRVNGIFKLFTMISLVLMLVGFLINQEFVFFAGIGTVVVFGILAIYELLLIARNLEFVNFMENDLVKLTYQQMMKYVKLYYLVVVGFTIAINSPFTTHGGFDFIYMSGIGIYGAVALVIYMLLFELFVLKTNVIQIVIKYVLFVGFQFFILILGIYTLVLFPLIYVLFCANILILGKQRKIKVNYINKYLLINTTFASLATSFITIQLGGTQHLFLYYQVDTGLQVVQEIIIASSVLFIMGYLCKLMCLKYKAIAKKQRYVVMNFMIWIMPSLFILKRTMYPFSYAEDRLTLGTISVFIVIMIINLIVAYIVVFGKGLKSTKVIDGVNDAYNKWFE